MNTQVFLPGKSHGWRNLVGYGPWGPKELDVTEHLHFLSFFLQGIFLTQGLNPGLLHCRQILYHLSYREMPPGKPIYIYISISCGLCFLLIALRCVFILIQLCPLIWNLTLTFSNISLFKNFYLIIKVTQTEHMWKNHIYHLNTTGSLFQIFPLNFLYT